MEAWGTVGGLLASAWLALPAPVLAQLSPAEIELRARVEERADEMTRTLESWVDSNTGSGNPDGLDRFATRLREAFADLGFEISVEPGAALDIPGMNGARTGPTLIGRRRARAQSQRTPLRLLLMGHYDTVFETDSPFQRFRRIDGASRATGPGVADMKGGLVVLLYALRALHANGVLDQAHWTLLFNADEENGSLGSRATIEREARRADYGFVFEAAQTGGAMIRSRRGLGQFHLVVEGTAAHSGSSHSKGRSALLELAEKILLIEALTDYERGITLNVGVARGGTKRNIVPEYAEAWIDLRYDRPEQGEEIRRALESIAAQTHVDGTRTTLWGTLHRPPKTSSDGVDALLAAHADVALDLGIELPDPIHVGGGTDGSLMAGVGLPALDSMGVVGGEAHTRLEFVELASLPQRAALAAILLRRLVEKGDALRPKSGAVD